MPAKQLTDAHIRDKKPGLRPYKLTDGKGLYLEVRPTGAKLWRYRYRLPDATGARRENLFALGEYVRLTSPETPEQADARRGGRQFTLEEARSERQRCRNLIKQGIHPSHQRVQLAIQRQAAVANTFRAVAEMWIADNQEHWSPRYLAKVKRFLEINVYPHVGDLPIKDVGPGHVLGVIDRIKKRKAMSVAFEVRQWMSSIFCYGIPRHLCEVDHAASLKKVIRRPRVQNKRPMTEDDIKDYVGRVEKQRNREMAIALKLLLFLFPRPGNLGSAEWKEFDLERGEWLIPADKIKMRRDFVCPLPRQSIRLLTELKELTGSSKWLFPGDRDPKKHLSETALNKAMSRMGYEGSFSAHSFRATGKTLLKKYGFSEELTERQLAHARKSQVQAAYDHYEFFTERQKMMQRYANLIDGWVKGIKEVESAA